MASRAAAASPASPPPTTTTGWLIGRGSPMGRDAFPERKGVVGLDGSLDGSLGGALDVLSVAWCRLILVRTGVLMVPVFLERFPVFPER